jgi:hypothetical protein
MNRGWPSGRRSRLIPYFSFGRSRARCRQWTRAQVASAAPWFAPDSLLEGDGFQLSVPRRERGESPPGTGTVMELQSPSRSGSVSSGYRQFESIHLSPAGSLANHRFLNGAGHVDTELLFDRPYHLRLRVASGSGYSASCRPPLVK